MTNQMNDGSGVPRPQHATEPASVPYVNPGANPAAGAPVFVNNMPNTMPGAMPNGAMPNGGIPVASVPASSVPPMHGGPNTPAGAPTGNGGKNKKPLIIGVIVAAVVVIAIIVGLVVSLSGNAFYDSNAQEGQAPYKSQEEIMAELNRVVEEGMLSISIASYIEFQDGTSPGIAYIENVPSNRYVLKVTITLDSNGEVVYQSGGMRPNSYIESITLSEDLPAGTYPATATFVAYDPDTLEEVGQAAARITLSVQN